MLWCGLRHVSDSVRWLTFARRWPCSREQADEWTKSPMESRMSSSLVLPSNRNSHATERSMNRRTAIMFAAAGASVAIASGSSAETQEPPAGSPELEAVRALLKAHDEAMTNHDLNGVLACLTEKPALMGTGPGEIWSGPEEVKDAYQHFFEGYDKGQQDFEYHFKLGDLTPEMGWLMASGNVKGKKAGKEFSYPLNVSLTVRKLDGKWRIAAMHFSTLTGEEGQEAKPAKYQAAHSTL